MDKNNGNGTGAERTAPRHPIGVVAARTRLTPDVLRVWERRYGAVSPGRSEKGQRLYSDADVERLQLLREGTSLGRSIGQLVALEEEALRALVREDAAAVAPRVVAEAAPSQPPADVGAYIEVALERTLRMDGGGLESLLRRLVALWGTSVFLESFAAPLFRRIGEAWHEGRLRAAQEHLASAVMRGVLMSLRSELAPAAAAPALVVATPVSERHEIGALLVSSTAAAAGWRVIYLGPDLPADEIAAAAAETAARAVAVSVVFPEDEAAVAAELRQLRSLLPERTPLLVGGRGATTLAAQLEQLDVRLLTGLSPLREWLLRSL